MKNLSPQETATYNGNGLYGKSLAMLIIRVSARVRHSIRSYLATLHFAVLRLEFEKSSLTQINRVHPKHSDTKKE